MSNNRLVRILTLAALMLVPASVFAQSATTGAIAGAVRDATGAVLPGVTVEAASPALIEKVRTVVSDAQGNYKVVDLRPGTYSVTFTLPGFSTFKRDGLELMTGVTAAVNAEMKVGSLEETVTVTGASPVVDVQNVRTQNVFSREALDSLPTAKTLESYASLTLGATFASAAHQDVGGNQGEAGGYGGWIVHGNRANDQRMTLDGMHFSGLLGEGAASNKTNFINQLSVEETSIQTGGVGADTETGGVQINIVPKDGGNTFRGTVPANGTGSSLQSSNLTSELTARGIATPPKVKQIYDAGFGLGGRIRQDRLWFYTAHRWWGAQNTAPGIYFNATPHTLLYTPDLSRPGYSDFPHRANDLRLTWQASAKNKITVLEALQSSCSCFYNIERGGAAPEATDAAHYFVSLTQATWSYPRTNRLLFEAGNSTSWERDNEIRVPGVLATDISITELSTGLVYGAKAGVSAVDYGPGKKRHQSNQRFSVSYITGSHALKVGLSSQEGWGKLFVAANDIPGLGPVSYQFRFALPVQLTELSSPNHFRYRLMPNLGTYAQDQWTLGRLTLNYGLRYDHVREYVPAETVEAIPAFGIPERNFPETSNVPLWSDVSPRLGAAYDVFGNAKTAVKASLGRYVIGQVAGLGFANAPANRIATNATRTWADANGNFVPDCVLSNPEANGECGRLSNVNLGLSIPATNYDPDYLHGWRVREYDWQTAVTVQHELRSGMALNVGYFRSWYGNFTATANQAVTPADFSPYCVTAPSDPRLGAASGRQLCGLFDVNPARFGQVSNLVQSASHFGKQYEHYNGVDAALNARFGRGGLFQGGVSTGRTVTDNCAVVQANPQIALTVGGGAGARASQDFCHVVNPWSAQTQYKFVTNYPLPWGGVRLSGTYQNLPGIAILANNVFTSAQIAQSLGRNVAAGANGTATIALMVPNTQFEDRINQVDIRLTKILRLGRTRLEGDFDIYNALNASPILGEVAVFGPNWLKPTAILGGRLLKFGMQFDF